MRRPMRSPLAIASLSLLASCGSGPVASSAPELRSGALLATAEKGPDNHLQLAFAVQAKTGPAQVLARLLGARLWLDEAGDRRQLLEFAQIQRHGEDLVATCRPVPNHT